MLIMAASSTLANNMEFFAIPYLLCLVRQLAVMFYYANYWHQALSMLQHLLMFSGICYAVPLFLNGDKVPNY